MMSAGWARAPLLRASVLLHAAALAAVAVRPRSWPWALGALVLDHALITAAGLWPRSRLLGPNWVRLSAASAARAEVALTIDDGPDPQVTPAVLDILGRAGARATFFCIGRRVAQHPDLARALVAHGHRIENHTQHHPLGFSCFGPGRLRAEIAAAQDTITRVTGTTPRFFRAPAGLRNPFLEPVLAQLGLELASWTRRGFDTVSHDAARVQRRLTRNLRAGDILLLHDGHAARAPGGRAVILETLPGLIEALGSRGLRPVTLAAALGEAA